MAVTENRELYPLHPVLLVDDDKHTLLSMEWALAVQGVTNVVSCIDSSDVEKLVQETTFECILLDLVMPGKSGEDVLRMLVEKRPDLPVIIVTGVNDTSTAVKCMKQGAFDYLVKPMDSDRLHAAVKHALRVHELERSNERLKDGFLGKLKNSQAFASFTTVEPAMESLFRYCEAVAPSTNPVLLTGETGSGKELVAEALHVVSGRDGDLVAINVAGLDENHFSDALFGHVKGAFTGATDKRSGLIGAAANGTLFLDEIGDLSPANQVKLLRLLESREYFPVGADTPRRANARIIAATHKDLATAAETGAFRMDLYYRLSGHHVHLPPLRERQSDIPLLLEKFLIEGAELLGKATPSYPPELISVLRAYHFPGNVRELKSMVHDAVCRHESGILSSHMFRSLIKGRQATTSEAQDDSDSIFGRANCLPTLRSASHELVREALRRAHGNRRTAADALGITPQALSQRLKKMDQA